MQTRLGWQYYNHAVIPATAPHEVVDESVLRQKNFWESFKGEGYPLLARWTSDYDCPEPTEWWYVVKDTPFDFAEIKSNYRQKIKRGLKDFHIRMIDPNEYAEELYQVEAEALSQYPRKYRPRLDHDQFVAEIRKPKENNSLILCAFSKQDGSIAGYMHIINHGSFISLYTLKVRPSQERKQLNAAIVYSLLEHFQQSLSQGVYIVDGERSVLHETSFQDYLEKYFGFRKAYCRLHLLYRRGVAQLVLCLYPIRGLLKLLSGFRLFCHINSVLKMEEIVRNQGSSHVERKPEKSA